MRIKVEEDVQTMVPNLDHSIVFWSENSETKLYSRWLAGAEIRVAAQ